VKHGLEGEETGSSDAPLEVTHLREFVARGLVDLHLEPALAHHQDAFRAHRELRIQTQVAEQVRDDRSLELVLELAQVSAER
jgi:hypothetical protein